ncbi:MAG: transporter substrate-binding domain-containing protein [Nitrospinae bacterium]|nr:transporter substrate-binding domain-containing protein [Nitrospinota bacterium]
MAMRLSGTVWKLGMAAAFVVAVAAGAAAQDDPKPPVSGSVVETIRERGVLKVGMSIFVPWAMRNRNGELVGFEIDVANKVARDMGVGIDFVPTPWEALIPALTAGRFDVIISGMSVRPRRKLAIDFTVPYAHSGMGVAAMKWPEDYDSAAVTFSCRRGSTSCSDVERLFPEAGVRRFGDDAGAFREVLSGKAHAVLSSYPQPVIWAGAHPERIFLPTTENLSQSDEAFGLRKGDPDALNFFSNWILVNKANGWLAERHRYWFKTRDWVEQVNLNQ